jgi:hypothetical protein
LSKEDDDPSSVYLLPGAESDIRGLVWEVNFTHAVKGEIESIRLFRNEIGFPARVRITIAYSEIPYPGRDDYSNFERDMQKRLQENMHTFIAVPVDIVFHKREGDEGKGDDEEE